MTELNINCKLKITIVRAHFKKDADFIGKQDPFVEIQCAGKTYKTKVIEEGGKDVEWNEIFEMTEIIQEVTNGNKLHIKAYDSDGLTSD